MISDIYNQLVTRGKVQPHALLEYKLAEHSHITIFLCTQFICKIDVRAKIEKISDIIAIIH